MLWTVVTTKYRKWQHLAKQKHFNRSKHKLVQLITSARLPSGPKFMKIGWKSWVKLSNGGFFISGSFSGERTADPERSSPTHYVDVPQGCVFGGLIDTFHSMGSYSRKLIILGTPMGISSETFMGASRHRRNMKHIIKYACWLKICISGRHTMYIQKKIRERVFSRVNFINFYFKGNFTAQFQSTA
jgi:hypothetical protein